MDGMRQVLMHFSILWLDCADRCLGHRNLREDTEYAFRVADMEIELCNPVYVLQSSRDVSRPQAPLTIYTLLIC